MTLAAGSRLGPYEFQANFPETDGQFSPDGLWTQQTLGKAERYGGTWSKQGPYNPENL